MTARLSKPTSLSPAPLALRQQLKADLDALADGFHGGLGYCLRDLTFPEHGFSHRGGEPFPTASTIKVAVMCEALRQVEAGTLKWDGPVTVTNAASGMREEGGPAFHFRDGAQLSLSEWMHLMIALSDNTATIVLRNLVGQGRINDWLSRHDLGSTRILNGLETDALGLRPLQQRYGLGMTTPDDMTRLFALIADNQAGSPATCDRMMRLLGQQYWDDFTLSQSPPTVARMCKTGAVDRSRSDISLIHAPRGPYILAIYTREQQDTRWTVENEGDVTIRKMAALVWHHYDPDHTWQPPPHAEALYPAG